MRKMRLLTVLAVMLLSCGIANAQTVRGDVNLDQKVDGEDITALADSVMKDNQSKRLDLNRDDKVNVADVVKVVNMIQNPIYFYLGTQEPTSENFTTLEGVTREYETLEEVMKAAPTLAIEYNERGYLLCPSSWDAKDLALQNDNNGDFFELTEAETDISGYTLFKTEEVEGGAVTVLKTKADAEEYERKLHPQYFWLGNTFPTKDYLKDVDGIVTTYTSLGEAMEKASRDYSMNEWAVVLYPYSWGEKDELVFLDSANKQYYATKKKTVPDFPDYLYYESTEKIGANTTITLSTKTDAEAAEATLYVKPDPVTPVNPDPVTPVNPDPVTPVNPDPVTPVNPDPVTPVVGSSYAVYTGGNGITFVIINNCGYEARFSGKVILNLSKNPNDWANSTQANANMHAPTVGSSWAYNDIIIPAGGSYTSPVITTIDAVYPQYAGTNFTDGSWYLMNYDNGPYGHPVFLYTREYSRSRSGTSGSQHMYAATPTQNTKLQRGYTYYLNLNWKNPEASLWPDTSGSKYIILGYQRTDL